MIEIPVEWFHDLWEALKGQGAAAMLLFVVWLMTLRMLIKERSRGHEAWKQLMGYMVQQAQINTKQTTLLEVLFNKFHT